MAGRAHHGNRTGVKEGVDRVDGGCPFALLEVLERLLGELGRKLDEDLVGGGVNLNRESGVPKHRHHLVVPGEDDRLEDSDAPGGGDLSQFPQQDRAQPLMLTRVGDRECDFSMTGAGHCIHRVPDDATLGPAHGDQPQCVPLVFPR